MARPRCCQAPTVWVVAALLLSAASFTSAQRPGTTPAQSSAAVFKDWIDAIEAFGNMSSAQQEFVLLSSGFVLQQRLGLPCNIFGGRSQCQALDAKTSYVTQCGAQAEQLVDCALYADVIHNTYDSPVDNLEDYLARTLGSQIKAMCPQCFDRVQALWCALAVPSCGTFQTVVKNGLLPVISKAVKAYSGSASATHADAVGSIMKEALQIMGVGLPCRSMCEALESTCSCTGPSTETLGSLLTWMASQPQLKKWDNQPMLKYSRVLFKQVWDRPFCSLFPEQSSMPGRCTQTPPTQCTSQRDWCDATHPERSDTMKYIQSLLLMQLLRATTGWFTQDNLVIWGIHDEVKNAALQPQPATGEPDLSGYTAADRDAGRSGLSTGQIVGITFLCMVALCVAGVAAVAGWRWWRQRESERGYTELIDKDGFVSLSDNPR